MPLTNRPIQASVVAPMGLSSIPMLKGAEKASQTYKKGAFLIDDDAGRITLSTSPITAAAVAQRTFGMALFDATGTTDADVNFVWLGPQTKIRITLSDSTAGTVTLAQTHAWKVYPITIDGAFSTGRWYLDAAAVSDTGGGIVVGFESAIGTVDPVVYCILTNTVRGGANAGSGTF